MGSLLHFLCKAGFYGFVWVVHCTWPGKERSEVPVGSALHFLWKAGFLLENIEVSCRWVVYCTFCVKLDFMALCG